MDMPRVPSLRPATVTPKARDGESSSRRSIHWLLAVAFLPAASQVHAAVVASGTNGFTVHEEVEFAGSTESAWSRLIDVASWWNPKHTYSGQSSNLSLALQPGGCWCEKLANGGFVRHMEVVMAVPRKLLRLTGGLGPLQALGATGALTFTLRSTSAMATKVTAEYTVAGYSADGFSEVAAAVDEVLGEQMSRLATK